MNLRAIVTLAPSLIVMCIAAHHAQADITAYGGVVDLRSDGDDFFVVHHHDWSESTHASRYAMMTTHQDPFREDNNYAYIAFYSKADSTLLRKLPCPALTWLGVSSDSRYVIGLSNIKLDNPFQVVVYNRSGELLLKRHICLQVAYVPPEVYRRLRDAYPHEFEYLAGRIWTAGGIVYVDYMSMSMPRRLGPLWDILSLFDGIYPNVCQVGESVTNWVDWYNRKNPAPVVMQDAGKLMLYLNAPKGERFALPFTLDVPRD